jgi:uncharacterized protein (TIGR02266 family)
MMGVSWGEAALSCGWRAEGIRVEKSEAFSLRLRRLSWPGRGADQAHAVESPERRLTRESAALIREFVRLNRRRHRPDPSLSPSELARWEELRWWIEELLSAPGRSRRPARKALRVPADLKVHYSDPEHDALGSAHEIAECGLFLATDSPPPVGTPLHLKLVGDRGETIEVEGTVVWTRGPGEPGGPPGIGVEFSSLDHEQREAVVYLVERALAAL